MPSVTSPCHASDDDDLDVVDDDVSDDDDLDVDDDGC